MVLEKTLESLLDDEIKLVNPKGNQPHLFIGRIVAEAEASILWSPDVRSQMEKTSMLGNIEGERRRDQQRMQ